MSNSTAPVAAAPFVGDGLGDGLSDGLGDAPDVAGTGPPRCAAGVHAHKHSSIARNTRPRRSILGNTQPSAFSPSAGTALGGSGTCGRGCVSTGLHEITSRGALRYCANCASPRSPTADKRTADMRITIVSIRRARITYQSSIRARVTCGERPTA